MLGLIVRYLPTCSLRHPLFDLRLFVGRKNDMANFNQIQFKVLTTITVPLAKNRSNSFQAISDVSRLILARKISCGWLVAVTLMVL